MSIGRNFPNPAASRQFPLPTTHLLSPAIARIPSMSGLKTVLVEIYLDSGIRYIAQEGVATAGRFYEPRLLSLGTINREISYITGDYRNGTLSLTLASPNREWESIVSNEPLRLRRIIIRYANTTEPLEDAAQLFSGVITDFELNNNTIVLACRDTTFDIFDQSICASMLVMDTTNFPYIPPDAPYIGQVAPFVSGRWDLYTYANDGGNYPLPAYLVDPAIGQTKYRYVITCQKLDPFLTGVIYNTSSLAVRAYGEDAFGAWTAATAFDYPVTGASSVVINFDYDQRDDARANELEITCSGLVCADGILLNDFAGGQVLTDPPTQLYVFLRDNVPGITSTDFDRGHALPSDGAAIGLATSRSCGNDSIYESRTNARAVPNSALMWVGGDPGQTFADVIRGFSDSYRMGMYTTRNGKYAMYHWSHAGSRDGSLNASGLYGYITIDEDSDIIKDSYSCKNTQDIATEVMTEGGMNFVDNKSNLTPITKRSAFLTYTGGKKRHQHVTGPFLFTTTADTADALLDLYSPINRLHEFRVPIDRFYDLELTKLISIVQRCAPGSYMREVLKDLPSAYWRFGEKYGTSAYDSSGNALTGTYTGGYTLDKTGALVGDSNSAVSFNGTTGYVTVPDNDLLDPGDTFTLECWIQLISPSVSQFLIDKGPDGGYLLLVNSSAIVLNKHDTGDIASSSISLTANVWTHVVATKSGAVTRLYINSLDVTGTVTNQTIVATAAALVIGGRSGAPSDYTNGRMDEVAIYPTALSADRIRVHYLAGLAKYSPTVLARIVALETDLNPDRLNILVRALEVKTTL